MSAYAAGPASVARLHRYAGGMVLVLILSFFLLPQAFAAKTGKAPAPTNAECLACHNPEAGLTKEAGGKQVSLAVDEKKFGASIHGQMFQCVDCHKDVKTSPHESTPA